MLLRHGSVFYPFVFIALPPLETAVFRYAHVDRTGGVVETDCEKTTPIVWKIQRFFLRVNDMNKIARTFVLLFPVAVLFGCENQQPASYSADVEPFVDKYCMRCHDKGGEGAEASGLRMDTYENLMKGTVHGPVVKPGDSFTSALVMLVEGRADPSLRMPHDEGEKPTQAEIDRVKAWIDQGAKNN